jgi:hypothetical protein
LNLQPVSADKAVESQAGGFRHRRDGLAYRLAVEDACGHWRPTKRVTPSRAHLSRKLCQIHDLRQEIRDASHVAFAKARQKTDFNEFLKCMKPLTRRYLRFYELPFLHRVVGKLRRSVASMCPRLARHTLCQPPACPVPKS